MLNCQQATLLLERTAGQPQRVGSLLALRVHLRLCVLCSRYQHQTHLIAQTARFSSHQKAVQLREEFKDQLGEEILRRLASGQ